MTSRTTRIIGIGNPLMGDDGIGISAIGALQQAALPAHVELLDGGCGGLSLLPLLTDCQQLIIIDAADFGAPPASIKVLAGTELDQLPAPRPGQACHNFGLAEILSAATKLGTLPPVTLVLMQIATCQPHFGLSPKVAAALPRLIAAIQKIPL